ncbi:amidohydrolase [Thalassobacillus pellis]|uniref:amidohydrolase n=1 Tax=Thalassobacillus pellis TaxID=748008 RepID=UPI001EF8A4E2|nr:amidohydrolase [Thalassobacillus pellis]MBM7552548.1 putative amidohydrolase YtcJ [Thalassobacillus pellis]
MVVILDNVYIYQPYDSERTGIHHVEIEDGKIIGIYQGRFTGSGQEVKNGHERTLTASFNDSHMHLLRYGLLKKELDLTEVTSWDEMKDAVRNHYKEMEEGDWIFGKGFDDGAFDDIDNLLTADTLEEIFPDKYMFFLHQDGHECVISRKALNLVRKEKEFEKEPDFFKETDEDGNWNGRFKDTAVHYIKRHFWGRSVKDAKEALKQAFPYLLEYGITSVHTDDLNFIKSFDNLWQAYTELEKENELPIDVHLHHYIFDRQDLDRFIERDNKRTGDGTEQVKVGAIKIFLDGTQRLFTSAMRNPYPVNPSTEGTLVYSQDELNEMIRTASENDMQVAMHAIGDRAVEEAITALEQPEARTKALRHRIIHAQCLAPDLIARMEKLKPFVETQPSFLMEEWQDKGKWTPEDLLPYCDAYESMLKSHIPITLSSDLPIGSINPMESIYAAVTRMDLKETPEGGWMPQEKISLDDAYNSFTVIPAELESSHYKKGKIAEGYQADFVLLDRNPKETPPEQVKDIVVEETWFRGKQVFQKNSS